MSFANKFFAGASVLFIATALPLSAQYWTSFENNTRYLALGDSISAGYGAKPVTHGFTHQLYQSGVFDQINNLVFCSLAVPNALSRDVLAYQVPMAKLCFAPTGAPFSKFITLSVGGNDAFLILDGTDPNVVFKNLGTNLGAIIGSLKQQFPDVKIYIMNYWDPKLPIPGQRDLVLALNQTIGSVVAAFPPQDDVVLVDVFSAFEGRDGLLLGERRGSAPLETHPTNAGYQVIAATFAKAIQGR